MMGTELYLLCLILTVIVLGFTWLSIHRRKRKQHEQKMQRAAAMREELRKLTGNDTTWE